MPSNTRHFILAPPPTDACDHPDLSKRYRWAEAEEWLDQPDTINDLAHIARRQAPWCLIWRWQIVGQDGGRYLRVLKANEDGRKSPKSLRWQEAKRAKAR